MCTFKKLSALCLTLLVAVTLGCSGDSTDSTQQLTKKNTAKVLENDQQITTNTNDQATPAVAYDTKNHKYLTVWTDMRDGTNDVNIYGAICTGSGSGSSTSMACGSDFYITKQLGNQTQPKVAFYPDSTTPKFFVVWTDTSAGYGQIKGIAVTANSTDNNGTLVGTEKIISTYVTDLTSDNGINQSDPDIVYNPIINKFVVTWLDKSIADTSQNVDNKLVVRGAKCFNSYTTSYIPLPKVDNSLVRTVEVDPATGDADANTRKNSTELVSTGPAVDTGSSIIKEWITQRNESNPKIGYDRNGNYFVAWSGNTETVKTTINYTVGAITAPATQGVCTYTTPTPEITSADNGPKIKIRQNDGLDLVKDYSFGTGNALYPTLATDPNNNRTLLAWEEDQQIRGQLVDLGSFVAYGPAIPISIGTGARTAPAAAFDNVNQRFLVTWEDARNGSASVGNIDIYSQFVDPQGALSGGNTIVTVAPGNQLAPAVAFGDVIFRDFLVVWKDGRASGDSDIYGQLLEYSTAPQLLISDSSNTPILNGAISFPNIDITSTTTYSDFIIRLTNNGNSQLTISDITNPADPFSIISPKPQTISPGTSVDMTVRFAPTGQGSFSGDASNDYKITFTSNGGNAVLYLSGTATGSIPLTVSTTSLPDGVAGSAYSPVKLSGSGGTNPYTAWTVTSGALPSGLGLDATTGTISGTIAPTENGIYTFAVTTTDQAGTVSAPKTLTINITTIGITTTSPLPAWTQNQTDYSQTFAISGTTSGSLTWSISAGSGAGTLSPVPGLTLNASTGTLSGTPTASGTYTFTAKVVDGAGRIATKQFTVSVNSPLSISTSSLPGTVLNGIYSQKLSALGGTQPYTWSIVSGSLPPGFSSIDPSTGTITGQPSSSGTSNFTVQVADNIGATATKAFSITVNPPLDITTPEGAITPIATMGQSYTKNFVAEGGSGMYDWSVVSGSLPAGMTLSSVTGMLSGTPTVSGIYTFSVLVKDTQYLNTVFRTYILTVVDPTTAGSTTVYYSDATANLISSVSFGNVFVGSTGKKTLTVTNNSPSTVTISSIASTNSAYFTDLPAVFDLPGKASKTFVISFIPGSIKTYSGDLVLTDSNAIQYKLSMSGTGSPLSVSAAAGNGTVGTVTPLSPAQVPVATMPAGLTVTAAGEFTITGLTSSPATVTLTFDPSVFPASPVFYAIDNNGLWHELTGTVSGNTFTYALTDNDVIMDRDSTFNSIRSLVAIGTTSSTGTGTGATGSGTPPSSGGKSGCFIATAAYGSYLDPNVMVLRHFRDDVLLKSPMGTAFVKFYYATSPPIADFIRDHEVLRTVTRWMLTPLIYAVKYHTFTFAFALAILGYFGMRKRMRKSI